VSPARRQEPGWLGGWCRTGLYWWLSRWFALPCTGLEVRT
jgi:hypothetical protein